MFNFILSNNIPPIKLKMSDYEEEVESEEYNYSTEESTPYDYENNSDFDITPTIKEQPDELLGVEMKVKPKEKEKEKYMIESCETLKNKILQDIQMVQESIETTKDETQNLMDFYHWNSEKLLNDFFEIGKKKLLQKVNMFGQKNGIYSDINEEEFTCPGCFDDFTDFTKTTKNPFCTHRFCNDCWKEYLSIKIKDCSKKFNCMGSKCPTFLSETFVMK